MSTAPGVTVTTSSTTRKRAAAGKSTWYVAGLTQRGPLTVQDLRSIDDFDELYGDDVAFSYTRQAVRAHFLLGGSLVRMSRALGPNPTTAKIDLNNASAAAVLRVSAASPGEWANGAANGLKAAIVAGDVSGFKVVVTYNGTTVFETGDCASTTEAIAAGQAVIDAGQTVWVVLSQLGGTGNPAVAAAANLTGGADDHASAGATDYETALTRFGRDLGPGQVSVPGVTSSAVHAKVIAHANATNRHAVLDFADTPTVATLTTASAGLRGVSGRVAEGWAPWAKIPGETAGTTSTVPWSAIQTGMMAREDRKGTPVNQPAAGEEFGVADQVVALTQPAWSDADRATLNDAAVNVAITTPEGAIVAYGNRSLAAATDKLWRRASGARLVMVIVDELYKVSRKYVHRMIDPQGKVLSELGGELSGEVVKHYVAGELYGETPEQAFLVDTRVGEEGEPNSLETIADDQANADVEIAVSRGAERVSIQLRNNEIGVAS